MKRARDLFLGLFFVLFFSGVVFGQDCLPNGDLNGNATLEHTDATQLLLCLYSGPGNCPPLPAGDLNCDGWRDLADLLLELQCVFVGAAPLGPCPIADVRPTVPDPSDSIIVQSRIVFPPGGGAPYTSLRVWITNKDTLSGVTLPLVELQTEAPAYAVLSAGGSVVTRLTSTLGAIGGNKLLYAGVPPGPDPFMITGHGDGETMEPPNATRKALWDINFDEILGPCGTVEFDSLALYWEHTIAFVNSHYRRVPVNFQMGQLAVKGDVNGGGFLDPSDVVLLLVCTYSGGPCPLCPADVNSNGFLDPPDVVLLLGGVFAGTFMP